jgi:hypothetical protein
MSSDLELVAGFWPRRLTSMTWLVFALTLSLWPGAVLRVRGDPYPESTCLIPHIDGILPIADGDVVFNTDSQYLARFKGQGLCNSTGVVLKPDTWHRPLLFMPRPNAFRSDFLLFTALQLWARCPTGASGGAWPGLAVQLGHWVPTGSPISSLTNIVNLLPYAESVAEAEAGNFTRVRIPLTAFLNTTWKLGGVEFMSFNLDSLSRQCVIDNVALIDLQPPEVGAVTPETATVISLSISKRFDPATPRDLSLYALTNNATGESVRPVDGGSLHQVTGWNKEYTKQMSYVLFLQFERPLQEGVSYTLTVGTGFTDAAFNALAAAAARSFVYSEYRVSGAVQANQEGYLQYGPKRAYADYYLADLGGAVFAVGSGCSAFYRDKATRRFLPMESPAACRGGGVTLYDVAALSEACAYAVGSSGTLLHFNGSIYAANQSLEWKDVSIASVSKSTTLYAIDFGQNGLGVAVGSDGTILWLPAGQTRWERFSPYPSTSLLPADAVLRAVFVAVDGTVVAAGGGLLLSFYRGAWRAGRPAGLAGSLTALCGGRHLADAEGAQVFGQNGVVIEFKYGQPSTTSVPAAKKLAYAAKSWEDCWVNSGRFGQVLTVGANSSIIMMHYDNQYANVGGGGGHTYYGLDCVSNADCVAVGEGGAVASGSTTGLAPWALASVAGAGGVTLHGVAAVPAGSLRLSGAQQRGASLVSVSGPAASPVFSPAAAVPMTLRRANDQLAGSDVWEMDFSSFSTPGSYRLMIPGVGMTHTFTIGSAAFNDAAWHTCRVFFYQRSGTSLKNVPYVEARWSHGLDHEYNASAGGRKVDAAFHWSLESSPLYLGETVCPLANKTCSAQSTMDAAGG